MTLDRFLAISNLTDAAFGSLAGISQPHVSRLRRGKAFPSRETVERIQVATQGKVKPADWYAASPLPKTRGSNAGVAA